MALTRYNPNRDYPIIASWYEKRGLTPPTKNTLSDIGWIADNRVAGWIYITPSNIALIEGIISNPDTVPSLRKESLDKLCGFLVDTALLLGYNNIIALTGHPAIERVATKLGFKEKKYKVFMLNDVEEDDL